MFVAPSGRDWDREGGTLFYFILGLKFCFEHGALLGELHFGPKPEQPAHRSEGAISAQPQEKPIHILADAPSSPPLQLGELHSGPKHWQSHQIFVYKVSC